MSVTKSTWSWRVYQCLLGSFPGGTSSERSGGVHLTRVFPPCHSPPTGRAAPQGGFPTNLMQINLSDWASLVQDVAAGLQVLPPRLSNCLDPDVLNLLQRLEAVTQVKFCHLCYHPKTNCRCPGIPPSAPPTSWKGLQFKG